MATTAPPTRELGAINALAGLPGWSDFGAWMDQEEYVPELTWPRSVQTYGIIRRDSQIAGLLRGLTMPIRRRRWLIDPNGARPEVVSALADDLGLDVQGQEPRPRGRSRNRFRHGQHLAEALRALVYGHAYFEQVGEVEDRGRGRWRLRKLAPRPQRSITGFRVARDGGLIAIKQAEGLDPIEIPVSRLVAYIFDQEPGNWVGTSMLRDLHRPWLIKDRVLRVGAINIERAGGVPYGVAPPNATDTQIAEIARMAREFKVGETSGGALPHGAELKFAMAAGGDGAVAFIRLMNEEMSRALLEMFMQLGQTETGSRALGSEFIDFLAMAHDAIADWYAEITNEHVIEDWVDWNYGEDEQAPLLVSEEPDPDLADVDLAQLAAQGLITPDPALEDHLRSRYRLPERTAGAVPPSPEVRAERLRRGRSARPVAAAAISLPDRPLRREPYPHEVAAAVDFRAIEAQFETARDGLLAAWAEVRAAQIDELVDAIAATDDLAELAAIAATPAGADALLAAMDELLSEGAASALSEAAAQGAALPDPDLADARALLESRAEATAALLARSLSETAARQAVARTGGALAPAEVAAEVRAHLEGLSDAYLLDQLGGALTAAQMSGRRAAMHGGEAPGTRYYASELLDSATCSVCVGLDGTEYASLQEAERDYPTGGAAGCLGGPRCRGTLVALYPDESEPSA